MFKFKTLSYQRILSKLSKNPIKTDSCSAKTDEGFSGTSRFLHITAWHTNDLDFAMNNGAVNDIRDID